MTFDNIERSRTKGDKISLYHFYPVNGEEFLYTNAEREVSRSDFETPFLPIPIQRGAVTSSGSLDKANLEIKLPRNLRLAEAFRAYPPNDVVNVVVREYHLSDPADEALVVWAGRVLGHSIEGNEARFMCEPITTSLRRAGLRRHYQLGCPHVLYGAQCAAAKLAATTPDIEVASVVGSTINLTPGWLPAGWAAAGKTHDKFIGGLMTWDYETAAGTVSTKRTVLRITSLNAITVAGPADGLAAGRMVRMVLGCNHQMTDCQNIHNNIKNFGGHPFIPTQNPFGFKNNFY